MIALLLASALAQTSASVRLDIQNVRSAEGQLLVVLFNGPDGFPDNPDLAYRKALVPVTLGVTTWTFEGLPPGTYAGFAVHDENSNGECDLKWPIPMPKEPFGATRNAKASFGPPKFSDASFVVTDGAQVQPFKLIRM